MPQDTDRYRIELDAGASGARDAEPLSETPFCIALLGDFSGRASRGAIATGRELADRQPIRIDRDSIDETIARLAPALHLTLGSTRAPIDIQFSALDDFRPDHLYDQLPHLQPLRQTRERLAAPGGSGTASAPAPSGPLPRGGGLLDQILDDQPPPPSGVRSRPLSHMNPERPADDDGFADFLRRAVEPHKVAGPDPRRQALLAEADDMIAAELRAILHHPEYQRLEACWRGVDFLVRRLDTDGMLRLYLIDVSRQELAADLNDATDTSVASSAVRQLLLRGAPTADGVEPWAVLVGLYPFGANLDDVALLGRLAEIGAAVGAPWLSGADAELVGVSSFDATPDVDDWTTTGMPAWDALRATARARSIGLVAPRIMLRLPYGEETDSCELLPFEEFADGVVPLHECYLWGNGALVCALLLGEAFDRTGWTLRPELHVTHLPLYVTRIDGELTATPCAEALLGDRALVRMLERGVMPLASRRDGDAIRLARFQSIATPPAALAGPWRIAGDADAR